MTTINPLTGREIIIDGTLHRRLLKSGVITSGSTDSEFSTHANVITTGLTDEVIVNIPTEIINNEIALYLPLAGLRSLCTTTRGHNTMCNDSYFLERWAAEHPDDTSDMMEWLALRGRWSILKTLIPRVTWDASSKKLAALYMTEQISRDVKSIDSDVNTYLMRYWNWKPTIMIIMNYDPIINLSQGVSQALLQNEIQSIESYIKNTKETPKIFNLPILYIGDRVLSDLNTDAVRAIFIDFVNRFGMYNVIFGVKQSIIAILINDDNIPLLRELFMIIYISPYYEYKTTDLSDAYNIDYSMHILFFTYASARTYMSMYDIIGKFNNTTRTPKKPDLVRLLLTNVEGRMPYSKIESYAILESVIPLDFDAVEYIDLCLKYPHKNPNIKHNFPRDVSDCIVAGKEHRARLFVDELKRRGLPYKYENNSRDLLDLWNDV